MLTVDTNDRARGKSMEQLVVSPEVWDRMRIV